MKVANLKKYSIELAKPKIRYYQPFQRLILRKIIQDIIQVSTFHRIDLFSIYDGVAKRGGFTKMQQNKRWIEIQYSLPYYKINFRQIYLENIFKKQSQIKKYLKLFNKEYKIIQESFVELHFISTTSSGGYYHFQEDQNSFAKHNFNHVDIYLNIKTICYLRSPPAKIILEYAEKYMLTRRWMILKGYARPHSEEQLDDLQIVKIYNNNASIALVGWNIGNILLAFKLHQLKFNVVLYTNLDKQQDMKILEKSLAVQQGIFFLDDGIGGPFSYFQIFQDYGIQLGQVSNYCGLIDKFGKSIPQYKVRQSEQIFLALLADFKFQQGNKNLLSVQLTNLLNRKKLKDELGLISWHLERYLLLNNLQSQQVSVGFHYSYLGKRKHKIFMQNKKPVYIKTCQKFIELALKTFPIIKNKPKNMIFYNTMWIVQQKLNQRKHFSSLIYSDTQQISQMISSKRYRISSTDIEDFTILPNLSHGKWINCLYRFKEKLQLKQSVISQLLRRKKDFEKMYHYDISAQNCSFQLQFESQFFYYFIIQNAKTLIATCKARKKQDKYFSSVQLKQSHSTQILKQFQLTLSQNQVLHEMAEPEIIEYSNFFFLKDQTFSRDKIIRINFRQRMFLHIGFPWQLSSNKLTSQIDVGNQILGHITDSYYLNTKFDQSVKTKFSQFYYKTKLQLKRNQQSGSLSHTQPQVVSNSQQIELQAKSHPNSANIPQTIGLTAQNISAIQGQKQKQKLENQLQLKKKFRIELSCNIFPFKSNQVIQQHKNTGYSFTDDPFGFSNPFIKSSIGFLLKKLQEAKIQFEKIINQEIPQSASKDQPIKSFQSTIKTLLRNFNNLFELENPFKLKKNTYLHSIGHSFVYSCNISHIIIQFRQFLNQYEKLLPTDRKIYNKAFGYDIDVFLLDRYYVKAQLQSLSQRGEMTVYIFCIFYIRTENEKPPGTYYVCFEQSNLSIFYYHTNLSKLCSTLQSHLQNRKNKEKQFQSILRVDPSRLKSDSIIIQLMLNQVRSKLQQQITNFKIQKNVSFQEHLDKLLIQKLQAQVPQQIYQQPERNQLYIRIPYPETNEQKTQFLINAIEALVSYSIRLFDFKKDIHAMDVFFGYLSEQYFIYEMIYSKIRKGMFLQKFDPEQLGLEQILQEVKKVDSEFYKQASTKLLNKTKRQDYKLNIKFQFGKLICTRKFIAGKNDQLIIQQTKKTIKNVQQKPNKQSKSKSKQLKQINENSYHVNKNQLFKNYTFCKQFNFVKQGQSQGRRNQRTRWFLGIDENANPIDLDPRENSLQLILSELVDIWNIQEIYRHFQLMLRKQLWNCQYNLTGFSKLYRDATRKQNQYFSVSQLNSLKNRLNIKIQRSENSDYSSKSYPTIYCNDQNDKQTVYDHIQQGDFLFADDQIIICKY